MEQGNQHERPIEAAAIKLTPTSYLVLGMIALRGPSTPYDLKRAVGRSIGHFWSFPHSQLYAEPERLTGAGLLEEEREVTGRGRKLYTLTDAGRAALGAWLATPDVDHTEIRDLGHLKLFFGELAEPEDIVALAQAKLKVHRQRLAEYEAIAGRFAGIPELAYRVEPLRFGIVFEQAQIDHWSKILDDPPPTSRQR